MQKIAACLETIANDPGGREGRERERNLLRNSVGDKEFLKSAVS